jgi:hypothetical protein
MALVDSMETKASTTAADLQLSKDKISILEDKNQFNTETSERLIRYLVKHQHLKLELLVSI